MRGGASGGGLAGAAGLVAAVVAIRATAPLGASRLLAIAGRAFAGEAELAGLGREAASEFAFLVGPAALAAVLGAGLVGLVLRGGRVVGPRPSFGRGLAFMVVAGAAIGIGLSRERAAIAGLFSVRAGAGGAPIVEAAELLGRLGLRVGIVLLAAAMLDLGLAWWTSRISRVESARARRDEEIDPRLRAEQRRRHDALR